MRHSAKLDKIASALLAVQARVQPVKRDAINQETDSRYSTIVAVLAELRTPMAEAGLSYSQDGTAEMIGPFPFAKCSTLLMHGASGQWIETDLMLPIGVAQTKQGAAAVTFAKRMGLASACGVVSENEDRDSEGQEPEPVIEKRLTMILKANRPKGIGAFFRQTFDADGQTFYATDPDVALNVARRVQQSVTLTLKGYADGSVEILAVDDGFIIGYPTEAANSAEIVK